MIGTAKLTELVEVLAGRRGAAGKRAVRLEELAQFDRTVTGLAAQQRAALNRFNLLIEALGDPSQISDDIDEALAAAAAAQALAGLGANHVPNSSFLDGLTHWRVVGSLGSEVTWSLSAGGATWSGPETPSMRIYQDGSAAQTTLVRLTGETADGDPLYGIYTAPNEWYQVSANISSHRCVANLYVRWIDQNGDQISRVLVGTLDSVPGASDNPEVWGKLGDVVQAPAGAAYRQIEFEKEPTEAGQADSYAFLYHPFSVKSSEGADLLDYSPGPNPLVTRDRIGGQAVSTPKIADNGVTQVNSANAFTLAFTGTGKPIVVMVVLQAAVTVNEGGSGLLRIDIKNNGDIIKTSYYPPSQDGGYVTIVVDDLSVAGTTIVTVEHSNAAAGGTASAANPAIICMETKK